MHIAKKKFFDYVEHLRLSVSICIWKFWYFNQSKRVQNSQCEACTSVKDCALNTYLTQTLAEVPAII